VYNVLGSLLVACYLVSVAHSPQSSKSRVTPPCHPSSSIHFLVSCPLGSANSFMAPSCVAQAFQGGYLVRYSLVEGWELICKAVSGVPFVVQGCSLSYRSTRLTWADRSECKVEIQSTRSSLTEIIPCKSHSSCLKDYAEGFSVPSIPHLSTIALLSIFPTCRATMRPDNFKQSLLFSHLGR
jgi:hypothetical protein